MGIIVPITGYNATYVFSCLGTQKTPTWSLGLVWGGILEDAPTPAEIAVELRAAAATVTGYDGPYNGSSMSNQWTFEGVSVSLMTADGPLVGEAFTPIPGQVALPTVPINCSSLFTKNTSSGGRRNKGRAYIPPVDYGESNVSAAGQIDSTEIEAINERYEGMLARIVDFDLLPTLWHSDGGAGTRITSLTLGSTIATQRRRLR